MATNRLLRKELLKRLAVTPQRLSQRVSQVKRLYGPMSTEEGAYVLAHQVGIDLTKFLDQVTVDRIRSMLPKLDSQPVGGTRSKGRSKPPATKAVRIAPSLELVDAMLPAGVAHEASRMASVYPRLYVFENSLRNVIARILQHIHGTGWWEKAAPADVQKRVNERKERESKMPWHGRRGTHEIYYSDFGDLKRLVTGNWEYFKEIFPSQHWITQRLDELEPPRNIVAHNNPLSKHDENRIDLYFNDWVALLNDRRDLVP